jgi:hypothetical protein
VFVVLALLIVGRLVSAQEVRGFVVGGITHDVDRQTFPDIGGGAIVDAGRSWLAIGGEGETFWRWPYFAGRATLFGQAQRPTSNRFRPFVLAGYGWGPDGGALIGAGVAVRPRSNGLGLRATVEDYIVHVNGFPTPYIGHQVVVRVGLSFR